MISIIPLPPKPANALGLIRQEVLKATWQLEEIARFGVIEAITQFSRYRNGNQIFAVTKHFAFDVTPYSFENQDGQWWYEPVTTPAAYLQSPEEGRSGLLTWVFNNSSKRHQNEWFLIWGAARWIRKAELDLPPAQIWDNICEEIVRGETPLSGGGLPGWV
jgi:hypothetical protein